MMSGTRCDFGYGRAQDAKRILTKNGNEKELAEHVGQKPNGQGLSPGELSTGSWQAGMNMFQGQGNPKQKSRPANCCNMSMSEKPVRGQIPEFGSPNSVDHHCCNWVCRCKEEKTTWRHPLFEEATLMGFLRKSPVYQKAVQGHKNRRVWKQMDRRIVCSLAVGQSKKHPEALIFIWPVPQTCSFALKPAESRLNNIFVLCSA